MKKIILNLVTLVSVLSLATGATVAYFSDTETSNNNTFTMGTLDLKVGNQDDPFVVHVARTGLKPNTPWTTNYGVQWNLKNAGTLPGTVTATIKNIKDYENTCLDPEVGDTTCGADTDQGELSGLLVHTQWGINEAPWGRTLSPSFVNLKAAEGVPVTGVNFHLDPGQTIPALFSMYWDQTVNDNLAQGDSVAFDVEFQLNQD